MTLLQNYTAHNKEHSYLPNTHVYYLLYLFHYIGNLR